MAFPQFWNVFLDASPFFRFLSFCFVIQSGSPAESSGVKKRPGPTLEGGRRSSILSNLSAPPENIQRKRVKKHLRFSHMLFIYQKINENFNFFTKKYYTLSLSIDLCHRYKDTCLASIRGSYR